MNEATDEPRCEFAGDRGECRGGVWRANWRALPVCTDHLGADCTLLKAAGYSVVEVFGAFDFWENEPQPYERPITSFMYLGDTLSAEMNR